MRLTISPVPSRLPMSAVAAFFVAGLLGLACSSSGLKTTADAGVASGGQAGSTISSGATGGLGGTIGPGGAGGATTGGTGGTIGPGGAGGAGISGTGGEGGTAGSSTGQGGCMMIMYCGPGYQEIDGPCPAERQCQYMKQPCLGYTTVCMVLQDAGVEAGTSDANSSNGDSGTGGSSGTGGTGGQGPICAAYPMCNPGDQQVGMDCPAGRECYTLSLSCGSGQYNTITCAYGTDASVDVGASGASAGALDTGVDVRMIRLCGNGVLDPGEQCDDGNRTNGDGCSATCQIEAGWQCSIPGQLCIPCGTNGCDAGPVGHCGDGIVETGEECDCGDGTIPVPGGCVGPNNDTTYGGCTTGCTWGRRCGDGVVQANHGEQCDLGSQNGVFQGGLGECTPYCQWIPWLP